MQNTRTLSQRQKQSLARSHSTATAANAVDATACDARSDSEAATVESQQPPAMLRRSMSLGNKPRPAALDLTCIPDLMPDAEDLAAVPDAVVADGEAQSTEAPAAGAADLAAAPAGGAATHAQPVVRTPVAQRVMRMNKMSKVQDLQRVLNCFLCGGVRQCTPRSPPGCPHMHSRPWRPSSGFFAPEYY